MDRSESMTNWQKKIAMRYLSPAEIRQVDQAAVEQFAMSSLVLMENAGSNCARRILELFPQTTSALVLCGTGNNGGDGLVIARHVATQGIRINCLVFGTEDRMTLDTRSNFQILRHSHQPAVIVESIDTRFWDELAIELQQCNLVIDALLGTGAKGVLREPLPRLLEKVNQSNCTRIAIDVPTGLDADSGVPQPSTFRAHHTLTLFARKRGFLNPLAQEYLGDLETLPIGVPDALIRLFAQR